MLKIFWDSEFTGLVQNSDLISLGLVTETGHKFYAEFTDFSTLKLDKWVKENVIDNLILSFLGESSKPFSKKGDLNLFICRGSRSYILDCLLGWLSDILSDSGEENLEFWGDCISYDWVLLNSLWRNVLNKPDFIYYIPFDICTLFKLKGIDPDIDREAFSGADKFLNSRYLNANLKKHNSLWDALVVRECYLKLIEKEGR